MSGKSSHKLVRSEVMKSSLMGFQYKVYGDLHVLVLMTSFTKVALLHNLVQDNLWTEAQMKSFDSYGMSTLRKT